MTKLHFSLWHLLAYVAACAVAAALDPEILLWFLSFVPAAATYLFLSPRSIKHRSRRSDLMHLFVWMLLPLLVLNATYLALAILVDALGGLQR